MGSLIGNVAALLTAPVLGTSFALARPHRQRNVTPAVALSGLISALPELPLASPLSVAAFDVAALATTGLSVLPLAFALVFLGRAAFRRRKCVCCCSWRRCSGPAGCGLPWSEAPGGRTLIGGSILLATVTVRSAVRLAGEGARPGSATASQN